MVVERGVVSHMTLNLASRTTCVPHTFLPQTFLTLMGRTTARRQEHAHPSLPTLVTFLYVLAAVDVALTGCAACLLSLPVTPAW